MVSKEEIITKSISKHYLVKCRATSKIRKLGSSVKVTIEEGLETYSYDDGTKIVFDHYYTGDNSEIYCLKELSFNNKKYPYLKEDSYEFFKEQKKEIIDKYGDKVWEDFERYAFNFASPYGMELNDVIRNGEFDFWAKEMPNHYMYMNYHMFRDILDEMSLPDEGFITLRFVNDLHENDGVNRKIVKDKGHFCTSCGSTMDELEEFARRDRGAWMVFTVVSPDDDVHGGFIGDAVKYATGGFDWEKEFNFLPNQKFERDLIDEVNHIIIQHPKDKRK